MSAGVCGFFAGLAIARVAMASRSVPAVIVKKPQPRIRQVNAYLWECVSHRGARRVCGEGASAAGAYRIWQIMDAAR